MELIAKSSILIVQNPFLKDFDWHREAITPLFGVLSSKMVSRTVYLPHECLMEEAVMVSGANRRDSVDLASNALCRRRRQAPTRFYRCTAILFAASLTVIAGCERAVSSITEEEFAQRVNSLLDGRSFIVTPALALTSSSVEWQRLCFERGESLLLKFTVHSDPLVLALPYDQFFVDEKYVQHSLDDACVGPGDPILIKQKYPGHLWPVEFQKTGQPK